MSMKDLTKARRMVNYFAREYLILFKFERYSTIDLEILMRMLIANLDKSALNKLKQYVTFILSDEVKTKDVLTYYAGTNEISNPTDEDIKSYFYEVYSKFKTFRQSSYYPVMIKASDLSGIKELDEYVNIAMYLCLNLLTDDDIKRDKEKIKQRCSKSLEKTNIIEENESKFVDDSFDNVAINAATLTITTTIY